MPKKAKFDPKDMHLLVAPERRQTIDTYSLLSRLPIRSHHVVADIGCGPGYFAVPIAKYVHGGQLHALDVQKEMLAAVQAAMDEARLTNVNVALSKERTLPLEDESLDGALMAFVLQEATSPKALLAEAWRCLRHTGWLAVLEWYKQDMDHGPPVERRIDPGDMEAMANELDFKDIQTREINPEQYMVLMRK
jgi:ubiquinone/menaquinone biosynthesis C-methylase UbiE